MGLRGCVLGGVGGWVSEFWTSGLVYMLILTVKHEYSVLNSIWPKSGPSEFGKHSSISRGKYDARRKQLLTELIKKSGCNSLPCVTAKWREGQIPLLTSLIDADLRNAQPRRVTNTKMRF